MSIDPVTPPSRRRRSPRLIPAAVALGTLGLLATGLISGAREARKAAPSASTA